MAIPRYLSANPFPEVDWSAKQKPFAIVDGVLHELAKTTGPLCGEIAYLVGLNQKSFDNNIARFQVRTLHFNEMRVNDISGMNKEVIVELAIHWNTKLENLYEISKLAGLKNLVLEDVPKISSISPIENLRNLNGFEFSGGIWNKNHADSLDVLGKLGNLEHLVLTNLKVGTGSIRPIANCSALKTLFISNQFPTEDYAFLTARLPSVECNMFRPYVNVGENTEVDMIMITGKGKPLLSFKDDADRIKKYERKFWDLVEKYRSC